MSYTREVTIWCDGVCHAWDTPGGKVRTVAEARKVLIAWGWTNVGRLDYCPRCSHERREARAYRAMLAEGEQL